MGRGDLIKRKAFRNLESPPPPISASLIARASSALSAALKSSLPKEGQADVFEEKRPERDAGSVGAGGV